MITNRKRWIMQDCGRTTYRTPTVLVEIYDKQIGEYGFRNKTEALIYLAIGLWNEEHGIKNSWFVRDILSRVTPERPPVLSCLPTTVRGIFLADKDKDKILSLSNYKYLANLMNTVMEAFLAAKSRDKKLLRKEMHASFVREVTNAYYLQTYIGNDQYEQLFQIARRSGLSLIGMIRTAINAVLSTEALIPETWLVPFEVQDAIQKYLCIDGFTSHHFRYEAQVHLSINDELQSEAICRLIRKRGIPGTSEFLRRVLLFLMNSKDIPDLRVQNEPEEPENVYFDDNETYTNNRLSRKDFVRSIYQ